MSLFTAKETPRERPNLTLRDSHDNPSSDVFTRKMCLTFHRDYPFLNTIPFRLFSILQSPGGDHNKGQNSKFTTQTTNIITIQTNHLGAVGN